MSSTPNRRRRLPRRSGVPWNVWELAMLAISIIMIASPLLAAGYALLVPTVAPAQGNLQVPTETLLPTETSTTDPGPPATATETPTSGPTATATETPTSGPSSTPPTPRPTSCTDCPTSTATTEPFPTDTPTATATTDPSAPTATTGPTATPKCGTTGYDPCAPTPTQTNCGNTGYPAPTCPPTATAGTAGPTATAGTAGPTRTTTPSSGLRVIKAALDLNGQGIALVSQGSEYLYSIRVELPLQSPVTVQLSDTFASSLQVIGVVGVDNGTCTLSGSTLSCSLTPSASQVASVLVRVKVIGAAGAQIANSATATLSTTGERVSGSAGVVTVQSAAPTTPPGTAAPTRPPATSGPATAVPSSPPATAVPGQPQPPAPKDPEPEPQPSATAVPPPPPAAPPAAPPAPGQPQPSATPRPRAAATAAPKPAQPRQAPKPNAAALPTATLGPTMPPVTTPEPGQPSLRFNLSSDWGQVFAGDTFELVVTLQNAGAAAGGSSPFVETARGPKVEALQNIAPINDVRITDELSPAFELVEATGNGLTVTTDGQKVEATRATLPGGEVVTLRMKVRAVALDPSDTVVHNQAVLRYSGYDQPLFSNVVAVKIVSKDVPTAAPALNNAAAPTDAPLAAAGTQPPAPPEALGEALPHTSGGVPVSGFVLLGFTMLLHSVRVHRARGRI